MIADRIIMLLIAVFVIYAGYEVLYPINPLLAIVFVLAALYLVVKSIGKG